VAVGKRRVAVAGLALRHRGVDTRVKRAEGVGKSFGVAAGKVRRAPSLLVEDGRIAQQDLVVATPMPEPELVGALRVQAAAEVEPSISNTRVLAAGAHLTLARRARRPA
jgi:hypothetical protein